MRQSVFRILAGILAACFLFAILMGMVNWSHPVLTINLLIPTILFSVYAVFGNKPAAWIINKLWE